MRVLCIALLLPLAAAGAKKPVSAEDVIEAVSTSLALDRDDSALAKQINGMQPAERFDSSNLAFLQSEGIGPAALSALQAFRGRSATLPDPQAPCIDQTSVPAPSEQQAIFDRVSVYGSSYMRNLPNFLCNRVTHRYSNYNSFGHGSYQSHWHKDDTFVQTVRFVEGRELEEASVKRQKNTGKVVTRPGQSISTGEFGGDMGLIVDSRSRAVVTWNRWENYRGKRTAVLAYTIGAGTTQFQVGAGQQGAMRIIKSPICGLVYAEPESGMIVRITIEAFDLPPDFPVTESRTLIDYSRLAINDHLYNLPVQAALFMRSRQQKDMNQIFFRDYRKFETESVLEFTNSKITYGRDHK